MGLADLLCFDSNRTIDRCTFVASVLHSIQILTYDIAGAAESAHRILGVKLRYPGLFRDRRM